MRPSILVHALRGVFAALGFFVMIVSCEAVTGQTLQNGTAKLHLYPLASGGFGVRITPQNHHGAPFEQPLPLAISVAGHDTTETWLTQGYETAASQDIGKNSARLVGKGLLTTAQGTRFRITDTYRPYNVPGATGGAFTMTRDVRIETPRAEDMAFNSRFSLIPQSPTRMQDDDFFAPGVWYKQNTHVPPSALAGRLDDRFYFIREDRLALPLILTRDRRDGTTLTLAHLDADPTTTPGEDGPARITDARLQFGALGIQNTDRPAPTFLFPGTEGERTYTFGGSVEKGRWTYRSHPVQTGTPHHYRLLLQIGDTPGFPDAVRRGWRTVYTAYNPPIIRADLTRVYRASMDLLAAVCHPYDGLPSVPFSVSVPQGIAFDTSSQMGFVGQALPAAAQLLRYGFETHDTNTIAHAEQIIDFWCVQSTAPGGLPRGWYDIRPGGSVTWRDYPVYLRVASDGMDGVLLAWNMARRKGFNRPKWLEFCRRYGDWLVNAQNKDGSWARSYSHKGIPVNLAKDTAIQPIPFLVNLFLATGDPRYRAAARRAGEFCWTSVHRDYAYVGGTPDNPNVLDKEAGMLSLAGFLALYDMTQERRWLDAASQAAWFSETWVYCWDIPVPTGDPKVILPQNRTTYGLSLIATGHSGADNYMAEAPFNYYRLFLLTGEPHFREIARMLLHNTKQVMDWDGSLGYAYPGLLTEAMSLPPIRGHGIGHWLPWLTVCILKPLINLQDTFGSFDIDSIEKLSPAERKLREGRYRQTHGFAPPVIGRRTQ
jgi:hypothetical protein